jgi:hypothetical protein
VLRTIVVGIVVAGCTWSQGFLKSSVSVGVKGGFPLTESFEDTTVRGPASLADFLLGTAFSLQTRAHSASNEFVVGPTIEMHLPVGFSVEADGLYRPLQLTENIYQPDLVRMVSTTHSSWEVALLGKYHLPFPIVRPYIAAGPSFRVTDLSVFSHKGIAAAAGADLKIWSLHGGPELGFTHWGNDQVSNVVPALVVITGSPPILRPSMSTLPSPIRTGRNQLELLFGLSF